MQRISRRLAILAVCVALVALSGCGSGDPADPQNNNNSNINQNGSDLAPASIGDNTIHGAFQSPHDPTVTLHFQIATSGTTTGTYTYEEENLPSNSGTYTWTKTAPNTAVIDTSNNGQLELRYTARQAGNYTYARPGYDEEGTFTTDR